MPRAADNVVAFPVAAADEIVRLPAGRYLATYAGHVVIPLFGRQKLRVDFRLVREHAGALVSRWYHLKRNQKHQKDRIAAGPKSDLVRDWRTVFGRSPPRLDRIPLSALDGNVVVVEVRDVEYDQRQRELTGANVYSVVDQIIARAGA